MWINRQKIEEGMNEQEVADADLYNRCRVEKYPYFFKYLYDAARKDWKKYVEGCNKTALQKFRKSVDELKLLENPSPEEKEFLENFSLYAPLMDSNSPMNLLCHYLEEVDFDITRKIKERKNFDYTIYQNKELAYTEKEFEEITRCIEREIKSYNELKKKGVMDEVLSKSKIESIQDKLRYICPNRGIVTNVLVEYFYGDKERNKDFLFLLYGTVMARNALKNAGGKTNFPIKDEEGDIIYLGERYRVKEVCVDAVV